MMTTSSDRQSNARKKSFGRNAQTRGHGATGPLLPVSKALSEGLERLIEIAVALSITLLLFLPVLAVQLVLRLPDKEPVFRKKSIAAQSGKPLSVLYFAGLSGRMAGLPLFLELLTGRLALVGTSIREWQTAVPETDIITIKPGIVSLWDIRKGSKIAHEGQEATDREYIANKRLSYDLLLLLRTIPAMFFSEQQEAAGAVFELFDLKIDNITMNEAIGLMQHQLDRQTQSAIFFVNPDCMNKMVGDQAYRSALLSADHIFPDGIGLVLAGKMLGTPLRENINGTDMLPFLCTMAASKSHSIFLLGGKPGVAEQAAQTIEQNYGVTVAGLMHGYFDREKESPDVIETINRSGASILLAGFGAPIQEKWIARYRGELKPAILLGVGGLFDFFSGNIKRAPRWMREIGLEWVYRIMQEPARMWKRYIIGNPLFLYRVMKWKLSKRTHNG